ncbi:MAG: hypothetical protein JXB29_06810 [Sedimentisphaerales bacterium]|nr:hypothetical protein [Sedimentisphaerales bacterium]
MKKVGLRKAGLGLKIPYFFGFLVCNANKFAIFYIYTLGGPGGFYGPYGSDGPDEKINDAEELDRCKG